MVQTLKKDKQKVFITSVSRLDANCANKIVALQYSSVLSSSSYSFFFKSLIQTYKALNYEFNPKLIISDHTEEVRTALNANFKDFNHWICRRKFYTNLRHKMKNSDNLLPWLDTKINVESDEEKAQRIERIRLKIVALV